MQTERQHHTNEGIISTSIMLFSPYALTATTTIFKVLTLLLSV